MANKEVFIPVNGFCGLYEVSNHGRVKSLPKSGGNGYKSKILKQEVRANGATDYNRVSLCVNGKVKRFFVHRLVAIHFIKNPQDKKCVNHIDNNGLNNNINNLEWCTHKENSAHSAKQGRHIKAVTMGSKAASTNRMKETKSKCQSILKDRFVSINKGKHGNVITFKCVCGDELTRRSGSVIIKRGGICKKCRKILASSSS